jgi:hypothetical protein
VGISNSFARSNRRSEREFWAEFDKVAPSILGTLMDALVHGLREFPRVRLDSRPRMADFAEWGVACEGAFWPPGTFMHAYHSNRQSVNDIALDADLLGTAIHTFMANRDEWRGTAANLLNELNPIAGEATRSKDWPTDHRRVGQLIRRCAPLLRRAGIAITGDKAKTKKRDRIILIKWVLPERERKSMSAMSGMFAPEQKASDSSKLDADNGLDKADKGMSSKNGNTFSELDKADRADKELHHLSADGPPCAHCGSLDPAPNQVSLAGETVWLHRQCETGWLNTSLEIPQFLARH